MWSGETKTGWVASTNPHTSTLCHIHSTKDGSVQKTTTRSCPTLCSLLHVVVKKTTIVRTKKAHYLRVLGAKKRRLHMAPISHEHHLPQAYSTYTHRLY